MARCTKQSVHFEPREWLWNLGFTVPVLAAQGDAAVLDMFSDAQCTSAGREPYQDALYTGTFEFFTQCGGTDTARALVVARPADNQFVAVVDMQLVSDADLAALDQVMNTFVVNVGG